MKKILTWVIVTLCIYSLVSDVSDVDAVWYNWSTIINIPAVVNWTNTYYTIFPSWDWGYINYSESGSIKNVLDAVWIVYTWWLVSFSWLLEIRSYNDGSDFINNVNWFLRKEANSKSLILDIHSSTWWTFGLVYSHVINNVLLDSCPGITSDCVLILRLWFHFDNSLIVWWSYYDWAQTFSYNSSTWSLLIKTFNLNQSFLVNSSKTWKWIQWCFWTWCLWFWAWWVNAFWWDNYNQSPNVKYQFAFRPMSITSNWGNTQVLSDYLRWWTWTSLDYYLPTWLGSTGIISSNWDETWSWSWSWSWTTVDYFVDCESFLDVWCYIDWFFTGIFDKINDYIDSLLPDISFSWEFNSCWEYSTWSTVWIMQKFANWIAILNPFPPSDGSIVCTLWWPRTVDYQLFIPTQNFFEVYIPGQVPELEISMELFAWQTLWDLIVIFTFVMIIFYDRKHH